LICAIDFGFIILGISVQPASHFIPHSPTSPTADKLGVKVTVPHPELSPPTRLR